MPAILFLNLKGGVAKTTNAVAVAECLASRGKRVLVVDADHQCTASELLLGQRRLIHAESKGLTLHDLLAAMLDEDFSFAAMDAFVAKGTSRVRQALGNLDCLPCSYRIDDFDTNMAKARRGHSGTEEFNRTLSRLRLRFARWCNERYDYTIVDCPPSFAVQVRFVLAAADHYIVPSIPDRLSVRGSLYLLERMKKRGLKRITGLGTLWTMVRQQVPGHRAMIKLVGHRHGAYAGLPMPFKTLIPNAAAVARAMEEASPVPTFSLKYGGAASKYNSLCTEIEERCQRLRG